ncbi:MAG: hypothetical protein A3C36_00685 [Omnitrophica WOR_2 bacterium RIFCSPHIGHO2_02_FULL_52_10]|nr:MAG: hypothetical protein A3C36_00685 [Omnitrophica WOR_2 bacterium RIFCSPHIGHO2_02_FULL_52_10]
MRIKKDILEQIIKHAQEGAPIEMCGYLAGRNGVICKQYKMTNTDHSEKHFAFDPKEQFAAVKDARAEGLEFSAVYHSHPASPARPSQEDIRLAYDPSISYVIISLAGKQPDVQSFKIKDAQVAREDIEIVE